MSRLFTPRNDNIIDLASRERPGRRQLVEQLFDRHAKALRLFLLGWSVPQEEIEQERMDERTPERIVAAQLELEAMRSVIKDMRLNWRVAFVLQRFGNMSYEDIALHMGVTVRQVERYMVRAMRRIREARKKIKAAGEKSC